MAILPTRTINVGNFNTSGGRPLRGGTANFLAPLKSAPALLRNPDGTTSIVDQYITDNIMSKFSAQQYAPSVGWGQQAFSQNGMTPVSLDFIKPLQPNTAAASQSLGSSSADQPLTSKVKIVEDGTNNTVTFIATPELSENATAQYIEISEIRQAASLLIFIASPGRNFTVNAKLVSRTPSEAAQNFNYLHLMKSWRVPDKGYKTVMDSDTPRILKLYAYGRHLKAIPVVLKSINIDYPVDADYISVGSDKTTRMPIILTVGLQLQEVRSADDLDNFDINKYKTGSLPNW